MLTDTNPALKVHLQNLTHLPPTDSEQSQVGYSSKISDLTPGPETRPMTTYSVACETPLPAKSNKKNKLTRAQQEAAAIQLGLSKSNPPADAQIHPLFLDPCCPKFSMEEQNLLKDLFRQNALFKNMNLLEGFIVDLWDQQELLISLVTTYDKELLEDLAPLLNDHHIVLKLFNFYLFIYGQQENDIQFPSEPNVEFLPDVSTTEELLESYSTELNNFLNKIKSQHHARKERFKKFKGVTQLYEKNFKAVSDHIYLLGNKVKLLSKSLRTGETTKLLMKKISACQEFSGSSSGNANQLLILNKFISFIKAFVVMGTKDNTARPGTVNGKIASYIQLVEQMITTKFNKRSVAQFISAYKEYSSFILDRRLIILRNEKLAQDNPSLVHQTVLAHPEEYSPKDMASLSLSTRLSLDITDKWMNDLHIMISNHFLTELKTLHIIEPKDYITRMLMMLDLVCMDHLSDLKEKSTDPSFQIIEDEIEKLASASEARYKMLFNSVPLTDVAAKLRDKFSADQFRLSDCLLALSPLQDLVKQGRRFMQLDPLCQKLLQVIKTAKRNHQLDHLKVEPFKIAIQASLTKLCLPLCAYIMIIADMEALFAKNRPNDVFHLLPDDVVSLLTLEGFEDIFLEAPVQDPVPSVDLAAALTQPISPSEIKPSGANIKANPVVTQKKTPNSTPKPLPMPSKHDFLNAVKKRVIEAMLKQMGFVHVRTTGSHAIYHYHDSGQVVVPHSVNKPGTRSSIYDQAVAARGI